MAYRIDKTNVLLYYLPKLANLAVLESVVITTKSISSTEAQNKFGQVMNDITQNQTRYIIERRGNPQAIILSFDDFSRILNNETERQTIDTILKEIRPTYSLGRIIEQERSKDNGQTND